MEHIQALTFGEIILLGIISYVAWEISNFLTTKIFDKKGRDDNEEK